jgi:hypothetical protein
MKIYKTCRELSMFRFYEILDTKEYKYLLKDYDIEIDEKLKSELNEIWIEIFKEYIVLKDDREIKKSFRKLALINKLETKLSICTNLLNCFLNQSTKKGQKIIVKELGHWGYHIRLNKPLQEEINRVISGFKALKSSIEIKKVEFKKEFEKELSEEKINIDRQIVNVEQILGNVINSNTTMVSKWIEYVKTAEYKAKKVA